MLNKRYLILGITILILIALGGGFAIYYKKASEAEKTTEGIEATNATEATNGAEATNATDKAGAIEEAPQIEVKAIPETENGGGLLMVCVDKCGDGICQKAETACEGGNLNCVCFETPVDCPQDCK